MNKTHAPWWRGTRGEWYVAGQVGLMALVFLGPRQIAGWPSWPFISRSVSLFLGPMLFLFGMTVLLAGLFRLGSNLTPLPHPKIDAKFIETGPYRFVRHPMYSGGIFIALGWAVFVQSWLTLGYVFILIVFLDIKARREERWLVQSFPSYPEYQRRVRKFIPFLY